MPGSSQSGDICVAVSHAVVKLGLFAMSTEGPQLVYHLQSHCH